MSDEQADIVRKLSADVDALRDAITELAIVQAEALNAMAMHLHGEPASSSLPPYLLRQDSAWEAGQKALDGAKRSLEVATKLML